MKQAIKYYSKDEALKSIQRYCTYQDRCHQEVRSKLLSMKICGQVLEEIMAELIQENFLDEERFARSYAGGKFRIKQWGRLRIIRELKLRGLNDRIIRSAMGEIDEEEYGNTLRKLLQKKMSNTAVPTLNTQLLKAKQYALRRGYEPDLVNKLLQEILSG